MENKKDKDLILVVDDQPNNLKVIASVLSEEYRLSLAKTGMAALKILERYKPELILLDIMMPEMDGYEVIKKIKADDRLKEIPVIFLTAKTDIDDIVKGFDLGAVDYITKPFNAKEVKIRIKNHLNLAHAKREIQKQKAEIEEYNEKLIESEYRLKKTNRDLATSNKEKDKFFSIIAHDLKSPFGGLLGLLDLLNDDAQEFDESQKKEMIKALFDSARNVYRLLENLLEWSRVQLESTKFKPDIIYPGQITDGIFGALGAQASNKKITLSNNITRDLSLYADSMMIGTIIRNLLSNAIKFTNAGGKIEISAKSDDNEVEFCVEDNGIGMDETVKSKLFRINEHVTNPGTADELGTGLGLILCKEFAEIHGGKIWAESEIGGGSRFYFSIPVNISN